MRSRTCTPISKARTEVHWAERRLNHAAEDVSRVLARGCTVAELQVAEARLNAARAHASEMRSRLEDVVRKTMDVQPLPRGGRTAAWAEAAEEGKAPAPPRVPSAWTTDGVAELEQAFMDAASDAYRFAEEEEGTLTLRALHLVVNAWVARKPRALRSAA